VEPGAAVRYRGSIHLNPGLVLERGINMIEVTRLNNKSFFINCEWIETVEATPDTVITLTNGRKFVVAEDVEDIIRKVIEYKQKIMFRYDS
jgi:flagellar protein FlbD